VIAYFRQKNPGNVLLLLLFGVGMKLPMFLQPHVVLPDATQGSLFRALLELLQPPGARIPIIYPTLAFLLLFIQALMLTRFVNTQRMLSRSTYFPGMAYLVITSLFPEWNHLSAPLIINTILLYVLARLFETYNQSNANGTIYNIGLSLGIASFLFFPSLTFVVWILLSLVVMRPFRINEWLICVLGITTPFYFYAAYLFLADQWNWQTLWPRFEVGLPVLTPTTWTAVSALLVVFPFLIGGYYVQENLRRVLIQVRKGWSLVLLYLLGALFVPFVNNSDTLENWVMAAIPFATFHACAYLYAGLRIVPLLLFWLTVGYILAYQYYGPGWGV